MKSLMVVLIFTALLFSITQAQACTSNPCDLDNIFTPLKGYQCIPRGSQAICTCPTGDFEIDEPCRLCDRPDPRRNVCNKNATNYRACLEDDAYGTSYVCLCIDPSSGTAVATTSWDCNTAVPLSSSTTATTTANPLTRPPCFNGGNMVSGSCNCPSGFGGPLCELKQDANLCERIFCKNAGVCAIRNPNGPYESVCLCRSGTFGEYCELNGTSGSCSPGLCMNGGVCKENLIGSTRFAYCYCPAGYSGVKCATPSFTCPSVGKFVDNDMFNQGKYFECTVVSGSLRAQHRSCPKGLRYNIIYGFCTL